MDPIAAFLIPLTVTLAIGLLVRSAKASGVTSAGRTTVGYGWGFKSLAILFGIPTLAALIGMAFVPPKDRVALLLIFLLIGLPAAALLLEGFFVKVVYSDAGIETFSPWRKSRFVPWSGVTRVSFSPAARWHRIETASQGFIRLHEMKSGVDALLQELKRRGVVGA